MSPSSNKSRSFNTEVPLERILGSLEYSLSQFQQHQQQTLEIHQQYLQYQSQYTQTFFELMQQQHQLWTNVQTSSQEMEVKTTVLASAERSMLQFQEHQGNTLRVHEQYLNHQAKYAQNFFLLTQQSYAQFLSGDYRIAAGNSAIALNSVQEDIPTALETHNGNGDYAVATSERTVNGNGHYDLSDLVETNTVNDNGNGIIAKLNSTETNTVNGNGHHDLSNLVETNAVNGNGHHDLSELEIIESKSVEDKISPDAVPASVRSLEVDVATLSKTLLDVVSDKTGYPPEMLELDMDMEADLGIDSIKRVEILGALQEEMPELPQPNLEDLGDLRTLNQIIDYLRSFDGTTESTETQPKSIEDTFLNIVSQQTGYSVQNLDLEMSMKDDLGIGVVKRSEIFKSLKEQIPDLVQTPEIAELDTLAQVLDYLNGERTQKKTSHGAIA